MKLVRPYIPLKVKVQVIARQLQENGQLGVVLMADGKSLSKALRFMLSALFDGKVHLDHDPPLCLREIIDAEKGLYEPDANDPHYLVYRSEEEHRLKTFIRGDGAQLSDAGKRRKEIKRKRKSLTLAPFALGLRVIRDRPSRWPPKGSRPLRGKPR
jgi:hypothetical protein